MDEGPQIVNPNFVGSLTLNPKLVLERAQAQLRQLERDLHLEAPQLRTAAVQRATVADPRLNLHPDPKH